MHKDIKTDDLAVNLDKIEKKLNRLMKSIRAIILLGSFILLSGIIAFSSLYYEKIALAGDYFSKTAGSMLTALEWNNLDEDFATEEGDSTLTGKLTATDLCNTSGVCLKDLTPTCTVRMNPCYPGPSKVCLIRCEAGEYALGGGFATYFGENNDNNQPIEEGDWWYNDPPFIPNSWLVSDATWLGPPTGHPDNGPLEAHAVCCKFN